MKTSQSILSESIYRVHESINFGIGESIQTESESVHWNAVESIQKKSESIRHGMDESIHDRHESIHTACYRIFMVDNINHTFRMTYF